MNVVKGRAAAVAHVASSAVGVISVIYQVSVASRRRGRLESIVTRLVGIGRSSMKRSYKGAIRWG